MTRTVYITEEENWFVAHDIESGVASQGKSVEESLLNLKEAVELYYDGSSATPPCRVMFATMEVAL